MMRKIFFIALFSLPLGKGWGWTFAQDTIQPLIEQQLENLAEDSQNEEADYSTLLETLTYYRAHPLHLNTISAFELEASGLLTELQVNHLLRHIEKNGKLISVYELQSIDGFDPHTIEKILPYIKVADATGQPHTTFKTILQQGHHEVILRGQQVIENQQGFSSIDSSDICTHPNSRYIGSPQKIYARCRFTFENNISAGLTAEKDAGELFFKQNQKYNYPQYDSLLNGKQKNGFDFYSAHLYLKNAGRIKALAIGDYQIGFGQGLTAWSGLGYRKSSDAMNIKKYSGGIRPHTSADENNFMRGIALTAGGNIFQATGFFSTKKIDANITLVDSLNEVQEISSLQITGLHSTPSEISDKDAITQTIFGGNVSYRKRNYSVGVTGMHTLFDAELNRSLQPYNQFEFTGRRLTNMGVDYSFLLQNFNFFGETTISSSSGISKVSTSSLNGCILSLDPKFSLSVLHRNYHRSFQSLSANAFAESYIPINEQGLYFGITAIPVKSIIINAYYDRFNFPWLKYQTNAPSTGTDFLIQVNYTPNKKFDTYVRIRQKDKSTNSSEKDNIDFIVPVNQINYRWNISYQASPSIQLRNRVEYIEIDRESKQNKGFLIYQDATYKKPGSKISFALRYALFDTESFDTRIYAYETDMPGTYSIPSYYYKGSRTYVMFNYSLTRSIELWIRWSQTYYLNQHSISPGTLSEIKGNTKSEIKLQVRMRM